MKNILTRWKKIDFFLKLIIIGVILLTLSFISVRYSVGQVEEIENSYKALVGKQVVYDKDTVIIIDYSMFEQTVTFSNGKRVNILVIPNLKEINLTK